MKNGDGGFGPSYDLQTTTEAKNKFLVGIKVSQRAGDQHELTAALDRLQRQFHRLPGQVLVDGAYITEKNLTAAGIAREFGPDAFVVVEEGQKLRCPAGKLLARRRGNAHRDIFQAQQQDCADCPHRQRCCPKSGARTVKIRKANAVVAAYQQRMQQESMRQIFRLRGPIAEFPHAWIKEKFGLRKFHVRGLAKARVEALWAALTYNVQQWARLCWQPNLTTA